VKVYGPYVRKADGRRIVIIKYDDGSRTTKTLARFLMEQKLGRELSYNETVDHDNDDLTDDRIDNLQVLSRSDNARKERLRRLALGLVY
jgi:hypothetical protein